LKNKKELNIFNIFTTDSLSLNKNNMKISLSIILCFIFTISYSLEKPDSINTKLSTTASVSINSNGIASIPAFSLDKPALIASASLTKNRFSYDPTLAYGLDLRPWFIDNWLHYKIVRRPLFELTAGFNISTFGSRYQLDGEDPVWMTQRYFALSLTGVYKLTPKSTLTVAYWNDNGKDGGISGHFINLVGQRSEINVGKRVLLTAALQVFYINYEGNNDGLFVTPTISATLRECPFTLFLMGTQAISSNITPFPGFRWNLGLSYTL
jgi:hypothetical protein